MYALEIQDEKMAHPEEGKQHTAEYNALIKITEYLCKTLPIVDLLPKMTSKGVISLHDEAEIDSGHNDCVKVELFISKLFREMASGENERFYDFIEVMKESPKCGILVHKMEGWISHYKQSYLFPEVAYALIGKFIHKCNFTQLLYYCSDYNCCRMIDQPIANTKHHDPVYKFTLAMYY